ncbi:paraquat-inducible protein A domain containing protein [Nitzschia inconspicua]|uniref:Paraquat-inducible protein A domain containing protein n=1 Tax=Nitzschia inconspicua TaxID=303405 RepID=A0A9K3LGJ2_9STRA|nr:paraquat-inducible protein A domain containing protein [Nitzschia inconspicua]
MKIISVVIQGLWLWSIMSGSEGMTEPADSLTFHVNIPLQNGGRQETNDGRISSISQNDVMAIVEEMILRMIQSSNVNPQKRRRMEQNEEYVNFNDLLDPSYVDDDPFYAMLGSLLQQGKSFINGDAVDGPLLINTLMKGILPSDGDDPLKFRWEIPNGGYQLELPGISPVILKAVHVGGIDTFTMVNILNPTTDDSKSIQNEVTMDTLTLDLELMEMTGNADLIIGLAFQDVVISVPLMLAVDRTALSDFPVGALLFSEYLMTCLNMAVDNIEITGLDMTFGTIEQPTTSSTSQTAIFQLIQTVFVSLPATVPTFFDAILRPIVNNILQNNEEGASLSCPNSASATTKANEFVDLHKLLQQGLPSFLKSFVDSVILAIDPTTGLLSINSIFIEPWTFNQSGVEGMLLFGDTGSTPLMDFNSGISVGGLQADIQLRIANVTIENLDTMTIPLALLETVEGSPLFLNNTATIGLPLVERPLRLSTSIFMSIDTADDGEILNEINLSLGMEAMTLILTALLKIVEGKLWAFPIRDVTNLSCWLATIPSPVLNAGGVREDNQEVTLGITHFSGSFRDVDLDVSCLECNSPRMSEWIDIIQTAEAQESFKKSMEHMITDFMGPLLTDLVQFQADRILNESPLLCPHSPDYNPEAVISEFQTSKYSQASDVTYLMLYGIVVLALIFLTVVVMSIVKVVVRRRHHRFLSNIPKDQRARLMHAQARDYAMEKELNASTQSLFRSPEIPFLVRWCMPILIYGNIALFLSGHLSLAATVNIEAQVAGDIITVDGFYEFSVAKSTIDIWNAGGKALSILILIFSGIWPYAKQLITLVVWFLPPSVLSISRRGFILLWLDWLAKWSMIDIFVIIVSIASFRVSIQSPNVGFLPEEFYSINLFVVPLWGLYSNMTAQLVSQMSSHFIIYYHRKIINNATSSFKHRHQLSGTPGMHGMLASGANSSTDLGEPKVLWRHLFGRPHRGEEERVTVKSWVCYLLVALTTCTVVLVITGCILPSLTVEILGIIGVAVEFGQGSEPATTAYSVFTIVQLLFEVAKFVHTAGSYIGLGVLSCLFVLTVLVVPIIQSLVLLRQWFSPMTRRQRTRTSIANEVLQAWQYVEVYLLSLFVACWQLGPISEFMFNTSCGQFDGFFSQMVQLGILQPEDAQCFSVQGFIEPGSILLAVAALILAFLNTVVNKAVAQYFYDQKIELEKELISDDDVAVDNAELVEQPLNNGSTTMIYPVPVLFTDTFRWFVRSDLKDFKESPATILDGISEMNPPEKAKTEASSETIKITDSVTTGVESELTEPETSRKKNKKKKEQVDEGSTDGKKKKKANAAKQDVGGEFNNVLSESVSM